MKIWFPNDYCIRECTYFLIPGFGPNAQPGYQLFVGHAFQEFIPYGGRSVWRHHKHYVSVEESGKAWIRNNHGELYELTTGKMYSCISYGCAKHAFRNWRNTMIDSMTWGHDLFDGKFFGCVIVVTKHQLEETHQPESLQVDFMIDHSPITMVRIVSALGDIPTTIQLVYDTLPDRIDTHNVIQALEIADRYIIDQLTEKKKLTDKAISELKKMEDAK